VGRKNYSFLSSFPPFFTVIRGISHPSSSLFFLPRELGDKSGPAVGKRILSPPPSLFPPPPFSPFFFGVLAGPESKQSTALDYRLLLPSPSLSFLFFFFPLGRRSRGAELEQACSFFPSLLFLFFFSPGADDGSKESGGKVDGRRRASSAVLFLPLPFSPLPFLPFFFFFFPHRCLCVFSFFSFSFSFSIRIEAKGEN